MIVKNRRRLCGTGAALANAPIVQDKSYFEVKIQTGGMYTLVWQCRPSHEIRVWYGMLHVVTDYQAGVTN